MPSLSEIKKEIRAALGDLNDTMLKRVRGEIDMLENTQGLNDKNNLEQFYDIWKSHKGRKGDKNRINSWMAYYLGITSEKPAGDFLPSRRAFARGFPDIDSDFDDEHRQDIFDYIINKYGRENVGNIGTYGALKVRSCLTRIIKALDIAGSFHKGKDAFITDNMKMVEQILSPLPKGFIAGKMQHADGSGKLQVIDSVQDAYDHIPGFKYYIDKYPDILKFANKIEGIISTSGSHASGICISDIPLAQLAPLRRLPKKADLATQFAYEDLEEIGLIKFDVLAIATLTVLRRSIELIKANYGIDIDINNLPLDDGPTLALFRSGKLAGVFQCESFPMQKVMRDINVDKFDDVVAAIALFRPGPMENIPEYCARKKGEKKIDYFHPSIEKHVKRYLEKTYGIGVYQEQIMQICNSLAGFSISDGYVMIKGIGKKKDYLINKFKTQFIFGCGKNSVPENVAEQYWDKFIVPFARYGFNLAHAAAYGLLGWQTCFLKANYPDEFACAFLNTEIGRANYDKVEMMEKDIKKTMNIKILPRSINACGIDYEIERKKDVSNGIKQTEIRPSLISKGVGRNVAKSIAENRPYKDFTELARKTNSKSVSIEAIGALIDNGYFQGKKGIDKKDEIIARFKRIREDMKKASKKGVPLVNMFD